MAYASWSVTFGEQPSAAKWNILGTNDAYFDSLVGSGTVWGNWPSGPTYANITVGNGTVTAKYAQIGKLVHCRWVLALGTTSSIGTGPTISLPVTATNPGAALMILGQAWFEDSGVGNGAGVIYNTSTTTVGFLAMQANATYTTYATVTNTVPVTLGSGDYLTAKWSYDAA